MISQLKSKGNNIYYCSNCRMRQPEIRSHCVWCGNMFSNYETIMEKEFLDKTNGQITLEEFQNESDIHRAD